MDFHSSFKLNGVGFRTNMELLHYSRKYTPECWKFLRQWLDDKATVEVKTSGSTGSPKKIQIKKKHMENSAKATASYFGLGAGISALLCMSPEYIAGKMMLVRALIMGWELDVVAPNSAPLKHVSKKYRFSAMVPLQARNSLDKLHLINTLIIGGGKISQQLRQSLQTAGSNIFETYGMTETITHIAIKPVLIGKKGRKTALFKTLPGVSVRKDGKGCLVISAPQIADSEVVTNDLVVIADEHSFEWLGRVDNVINSGGIKLIPEQIEHKISRIIDTSFLISCKADDQLGEKLILVLEGTSYSADLLKRMENEAKLDKYEIPKEVYCIAEFVRTDTGKIQRRATLDLLQKTI